MASSSPVLTLVTLSLLICPAASLLGEETFVPPERSALRQQILERDAKIRNSLQVSYQVSRQFVTRSAFSSLQLGQFQPDQPYCSSWRGEHACLNSKSHHLTTAKTWSDGRSPDSNPQQRVKLFDGQNAYRLILDFHPNGNPHIEVYRPETLRKFAAVLAPEEELYRELIGLTSRREGISFTFSGCNPDTPYTLGDVLSDEQFEMTTATLNSMPVLMLVKTGCDRIWLAPRYNYAVIRRERNWKEGGRCVEFVNSEFTEIQPGCWLPQKSQIRHFHHPRDSASGLAATAELQVEKLSANPTPDLFQSPVQAGMEVVDVFNGRCLTVKEIPNGNLNKALDLALEQELSQMSPENRQMLQEILTDNNRQYLSPK